MSDTKNAMLGIAGEIKGKSEMGATAAHFGVAGLSTRKNIGTAQIGVAGLDRTNTPERAMFGAAGALSPDVRSTIAPVLNGQAKVGAAGINTRQIVSASLNTGVDAAALQARDQQLAAVTWDSKRLGDQAAREAWNAGVWFADYTYISTPYEENGNGGYTHSGRMSWRNGRELTFGRQYRALPLFLDCCGYRREITGTAPQWAHEFDTYTEAIELLDPDGYAAWDYPIDRARTMQALQEMMRIFPNDPRLWPVFSVRWTWDDSAHLNFARLPGWGGRDLSSLIPQNRTQRQFKRETRERWARQAIANALTLAADPDFRWMVNTFGKVMLGGMVGCACPRMARHLFAAVLCELFPDTHFWMLGQANFAVVNGLGQLGLLDRVWSDGTWWLKDATAERFAYVEDGLITMHSFETQARNRGEKRVKRRETFFTLVEMMAANLRSLLAAYQGLWVWPPPEPLPLDLVDVAQAAELKSRYQAAQLELGL